MLLLKERASSDLIENMFFLSENAITIDMKEWHSFAYADVFLLPTYFNKEEIEEFWI